MSTEPIQNTTSAWESAQPIACRACDLNAVCRISGLIAYRDGQARRVTGALRTVRPGSLLFRAGAPARAIFAIRQGSMKLTHVNADGDERIVSFHLAGDVIGLEAFSQGVYTCDAIALDTVQCCELPVPAFADQTPQTAALATEMVRVLSGAIAGQSPLARGSARERVINFLLDLSRRLKARGFDSTRLKLSMTRLEIANLLDTRIETVSRTLQRLHREQLIQVRGNRIRLLKLAEPAAAP